VKDTTREFATINNDEMKTMPCYGAALVARSLKIMFFFFFFLFFLVI